MAAAVAPPPIRGGQAQGARLRGLPWERRQCDDSRDAVARRAAGVLHALAAHQVQGRAAKRPPDDAFVQSLSDADMADLAAYYQAQTPRRRLAATDPPRSSKGSASRTCTTAPPATAPASPVRSKPRASPARTSTTSSASCAASRPDRLRPRRHHDHRDPAPHRRRDRQPRSLHRDPRRLITAGRARQRRTPGLNSASGSHALGFVEPSGARHRRPG